MSLRITILFAAFVLLSAITSSGASQTTPGVGLFLPFTPGETWYVCQGYNGTVSHQNRYAFDLTVESSMGSGGCHGDRNATMGHAILAPGAGTVTHINRPEAGGDKPFDEAHDMICLDLDSGGSLVIGHMDPNSRPPNGSHVEAQEFIGTVARASLNANEPDDTSENDFIGNGNYAHIHIEARLDDACDQRNSSYFTPFTGRYEFFGVPGLPDQDEISVTGTNQYAATSFINKIVRIGSDDASGHYTDCVESPSLPEAYFGRCDTGGEIYAGFRFENLPIHKDEYISNAAIVFQVDGPARGSIDIELYGEYNANPAPFYLFSMPSRRPPTSNKNNVVWKVRDAWEWRETRETPNLASIVQEIVNHADWNRDTNGIAILAKPAEGYNLAASRRVMAWERDQDATERNPAFNPARLLVTRFGNNQPVADAGSDRRYFAVGEWVELDGSRSRDPDGGELSYAWKQVLGPAPVYLLGADQPRARFRVPARGIYVFRLTVTDIGRTDNQLQEQGEMVGRLTDTAEVMVYCTTCPL